MLLHCLLVLISTPTFCPQVSLWDSCWLFHRCKYGTARLVLYIVEVGDFMWTSLAMHVDTCMRSITWCYYWGYSFLRWIATDELLTWTRIVLSCQLMVSYMIGLKQPFIFSAEGDKLWWTRNWWELHIVCGIRWVLNGVSVMRLIYGSLYACQTYSLYTHHLD